MINDILTSFLYPKEEPLPTEGDDIFQLPIAYLERKAELEEHTINDLELLPLDPTASLYKYVFNPETIFGEKTIRLWSKYYTPDTTFLKESQTLLKNKLKSSGEITAERQAQVHAVWQEIQSETGFHEKFSFIEWEKLHFLNHNAKFLQCLSMYNMAAPLFSLMMPIFLIKILNLYSKILIIVY